MNQHQIEHIKAIDHINPEAVRIALERARPTPRLVTPGAGDPVKEDAKEQARLRRGAMGTLLVLSIILIVSRLLRGRA